MNGSAPIVGRDSEVAAVLGFIGDDGAPGQARLLIEGEAGIGKTRLWEAGVARAHELGHTVFACRAVEGEVTLPFVGLGDLLGDVLDGVLSELPEVQRTALEVALLRRPTGDAPADRLFTQAERAELLADATRIRGVIPCAECAGTCAEV